MTPPGRDDDDLPPPAVKSPAGVITWAIAGCVLVLVYIAALVLMSPGG
jgi:hypothetical protein